MNSASTVHAPDEAGVRTRQGRCMHMHMQTTPTYMWCSSLLQRWPNSIGHPLAGRVLAASVGARGAYSKMLVLTLAHNGDPRARAAVRNWGMSTRSRQTGPKSRDDDVEGRLNRGNCFLVRFRAKGIGRPAPGEEVGPSPCDLDLLFGADPSLRASPSNTHRGKSVAA